MKTNPLRKAIKSAIASGDLSPLRAVAQQDQKQSAPVYEKLYQGLMKMESDQVQRFATKYKETLPELVQALSAYHAST